MLLFNGIVGFICRYLSAAPSIIHVEYELPLVGVYTEVVTGLEGNFFQKEL